MGCTGRKTRPIGAPCERPVRWMIQDNPRVLGCQAEVAIPGRPIAASPFECLCATPAKLIACALFNPFPGHSCLPVYRLPHGQAASASHDNNHHEGGETDEEDAECGVGAPVRRPRNGRGDRRCQGRVDRGGIRGRRARPAGADRRLSHQTGTRGVRGGKRGGGADARLGQTDGSTVLLDEIGDLPPTLQVHFLRVRRYKSKKCGLESR
jgi:hypothetical protein